MFEWLGCVHYFWLFIKNERRRLDQLTEPRKVALSVSTDIGHQTISPRVLAADQWLLLKKIYSSIVVMVERSFIHIIS